MMTTRYYGQRDVLNPNLVTVKDLLRRALQLSKVALTVPIAFYDLDTIEGTAEC